MSCAKCGAADFTPSALRHNRKLCRSCVADRLARTRGRGDPARRAYVNLRSRLVGEARRAWTADRVAELVRRWIETHGDSASRLRLRVAPKDPERPLTPENAQVRPFACDAEVVPGMPRRDDGVFAQARRVPQLSRGQA